jgi:glutathione peroxidase
MTTAYDFTAETIEGERQDLASYRGKAILIVNVASQCGFTPQYEGLQALYDRYAERGLVVLGFPCDQFGHQEPGSADEIQSFCTTNYGVTFPMFAKIDVNGDSAHPLYGWLTGEARGVLGKRIKWNFTKFLVDPTGAVVKRYAPTTKPEEIQDDVELVLSA